MSRISFGSLSIGVLSAKSYFLPSAFNTWKIQVSRYSPMGAKPPFTMLSFGFGITEFWSTSKIYPKPSHFSQAPYGELNENVFGCGSSYDMPETGSIKYLL